MNLTCSVPAICLLLLISSAVPDDKKNNEPFQGKWKIESMQVNGQTVAKDQFDKAVVTVTGDERILREGEEVRSRAKYKVDPTKNPRTIDISISEGPLKDKTLKGIYEFKDDTVTINVALEGTERPTDFSCKSESGRLLQVFKRVSEK